MDATTLPPPSAVVPHYFELSWSILSTIGVVGLALSLLVIASTSLTPLLLVPPILSTACAIANGLCFYAFYTDYDAVNRAVASGFADFFWLVRTSDLFLDFEVTRPQIC